MMVVLDTGEIRVSESFIHMPFFIFYLMALFIQPLCAAEIQEFTADYEIFYGDIRLGSANYRLSHSKDNFYRFDFVSELRFLIFSDKRIVSSELVYEDLQLRPSYYSHDRKGTGRDYFEEIRFDRSECLIRSTYKKKSKEFVYEKDIVDGLTVQLRIMLDLQRGIKQPKYRILDANKVREREFSFVGEETINIQNKDYHSVVYQVVRDNNKRKTQMWFSPERNYLPLKMVHFSNGKKKFNAHLVNFEHLGSNIWNTWGQNKKYSEISSEKYSCSGSEDRLTKGSTAMDFGSRLLFQNDLHVCSVSETSSC